jgi:antitoxin HicB
MMKPYPALFAPDDAGYVVTFRDVPEAITQGETLDEAREMAADALRTALEFYTESQRPLPRPSEPLPGEELITTAADPAAPEASQ